MRLGDIVDPDSLGNGTRPLHTEKEGIEALGMILAGYESARSRTIATVLRAQGGPVPSGVASTGSSA